MQTKSFCSHQGSFLHRRWRSDPVEAKCESWALLGCQGRGHRGESCHLSSGGSLFDYETERVSLLQVWAFGSMTLMKLWNRINPQQWSKQMPAPCWWPACFFPVVPFGGLWYSIFFIVHPIFDGETIHQIVFHRADACYFSGPQPSMRIVDQWLFLLSRRCFLHAVGQHVKRLGWCDAIERIQSGACPCEFPAWVCAR